MKNFLNPKGHQNTIIGSKVTPILLKGWILPIGGASSGEGLGLQPVQQACFYSCKKIVFSDTYGWLSSVCHGEISGISEISVAAAATAASWRGTYFRPVLVLQRRFIKLPPDGANLVWLHNFAP